MTNDNISKTETVIQILENAHDNGVTQTKLMSKIFLRKKDLKEHLTELIHYRLLSYEVASRTFKTTQKGLTLLRLYRHIRKTMKRYQF